MAGDEMARADARREREDEGARNGTSQGGEPANPRKFNRGTYGAGGAGGERMGKRHDRLGLRRKRD